MKNNRLHILFLVVLHCIYGTSLSAGNTDKIDLESFPMGVMRCGNGAKIVTATYTGRNGNITRRMIYDTQGIPVMHTAVYLNGNQTDTVLFDRESRVMATMSNRDHSRQISDGTISDYTKYKDAYKLVQPKRSYSVNIDASSKTPQGDWTKASYVYGKIARDIEYNETAEYKATLNAAQKLIEELEPEYAGRKQDLESNKGAVFLLFGALVILGVPFIAFIFMITRKMRPSLRYLLRHVVLFFILCPMLLGVLLNSAVNDTSWITMIMLAAVGGCWLFYGKKYFRKMAEHRELSNAYLLFSVIAVSGLIGLITLPMMVGMILPIPLIGTLAGYAAVVLLIVYHDPTTYRCPQCHVNDSYFEYKVTPDGRLIKVSKDRSGTVSSPVLNQALNRLERETVDKKTTTTSVYQMERVHKRCSCCGYYHSYRRRGAFLSQDIKADTTKTKEHADLD